MTRLTNLADVLRAEGLTVIEVDGWQTRGRGTDGGQYTSGRPTHVMMHHTASRTSAQNDVNYMTFNSSSRPIANLYIARDGAVWVMAAGPTNTNGGGGPLDEVARDNMNRHAIGIEIGNAGTGEPYPDAQQDASLRSAAALCRAYNIPSTRVRSHFEWSPGRKIDPAGPSRWTNGQNRQWDMGRFRADVQARLSTGPTPPPPSTSQGVIDMYLVDVRPNASAPSSVILRVGLDHIHHVTNGVAVDVDQVYGVRRGELSPDQVRNMLADRRTNQPSPFTGPWANAELDAAWNAARAR